MDVIAEQLLRARHKPNPATTALEKETERFKNSIKKHSEKNTLVEFTATASFILLELWNKYIKLVPKDVFNKQIISMGDLLFEKQDYATAKNLCYQWYLIHCITVNHDGCNVKEKYFSDGFHSNGTVNATVLTFKALIGEAVCSFYLVRCKDDKLIEPDHHSIIVEVLSQLRGVTQAGLYYEPLYWLVHNGIVHIYAIAQHLMMYGLSNMAVEYLLWAAVCMESSVPLMAVKFLPLRASIYTAICQCYYDIDQSLQAELFARRGLDKVNELARMENISAEETTDASELAFRIATLKLGVMVFKRSVLESRTKNKSILRTKSKPTVKDSIQSSSWPRSPTEKLLNEIFSGRAAQFLAVLKALEDHNRRPLHQGPPNPKTELDQDTIFDVYHELFCAGTELALSALDASAKEQLEPGGENCLLQLAITGQDVLSVGAVEVFARLAYNYEQMEVFNMLLDPLDRCAQQNIQHCQISLLILAEVETLKQQIKASNTGKDSSGKPQIVQLLPLARILEQATGKVDDYDLLLDTSLLLWKHASQYYQHIFSCDLSTLRYYEHDQGHALTPPLNFVQLLVIIQSIFRRLELWKVDVVLYTNVCLKLGFLFEGGAQGLQLSDTSTVKYDRAKLLDSRVVIEAGLTAVNWARCNLSTAKEELELGVIHCELLYIYYRLQAKLASTHLPVPPPSSSAKPSMLKSKVKERQLIEESRKKAMASVTAPDGVVPSWSEVVDQCANDQCCHMLLLMAQSCISVDGDNSVKEKLVKEAETCLLTYQKQRRPQQSVVLKIPSHSKPPAPELLKYSGTHMVFKPSTFLPDSGAEVCWYKLFGCRAVGSNVKVRLSDHHYPGLGHLVLATEPLVVTGLQPNEMYIFAVAAYSADGKLIGGSIGDTSKPLIASHDMPVVVLWGFLAQCAYQCKVNSVALRATQTLRRFITDDQEMELLQNYPTAIARLYLNSIFIHVSVSIEEGCLWCDQVTVAPSSLLSSQQARLQLCAQLLTALEVGQYLNSPSHCLQIVVMSYGLLMPLLQYGLITKNIAWVLMYCFSVLQEVPIQLLLHSQSHLHHMVAVISYNLAQLMLNWKEKNIFLNICEATKLLLLATLRMASPTHSSSAEQGSIPSVTHPLYQQIKGSVVLSEGNTTNTQGNQGGGAHNSLVTTLTTISSIMTSSVPTKKGGVRQRKGRRNNTLGQDTITDEMKSDEIRAIEAFILSNQGTAHLDDTELTGQEDINLLHTIINILPLTAAHKEVVKFHRRPHYLSLLVLLLHQAISEGSYDLVLEWSREARHWLNRRNELLLTHNLHQQRPVSAVFNKSTKRPPITVKKSKPDLNPQSNKIQTTQSRALMETTTKYVQQQRRLPMHLAKIEITRDDLTLKAKAVLKDRLTTLWKHVCRRRKLREVLSNEMSWRAQFNLCQAVSSFQLVLGKLDKSQSQNSFDHVVSHTALRLDSAMVVISGVIPVQGWRAPAAPPTVQETEGTDSQEQLDKPCVRPESARIEMKDTDSNLAVALGSSAALLYNRPPRPQSDSKTNTPPLREKPKPQGLLWEMQECFTYYQRAIVLAHRKKAWILLQNACRALWNAINVFCDRLRYSNEADNTCPTLGTMYATSVSSLYFAVDNLLDMVNELPVKLPAEHMATAPLHYTADNDDSSTVDGNFIARLGLLSVHVFYSNQHWEKLLHCGSRLLQAMSQYTEQILPVLLFAQRRLKDRITYYGPLTKNHSLHPAAHLDPGPTGHNIYGGVGYALVRTRFSTDPSQLVNGEQMIPDVIPDYQRSVCHCRSLMARYLASTVPALATLKIYTIISSDPPSRKISSAVELVPIPADQLHFVVEAYSNAIGCLEQQNELCGLRCELMSELGALLMHTGDVKLAAQWWERALTALVGMGDCHLVSAATIVESCGLWSCLLAGVLAARLVQYVYYNELDNHKLYLQMSATLLKVLLNGNISMPDKDVDFALYNINGVNLLPGLDVFSNPFHCNAHSIADALQYTCEQLVHSSEQLTELLPLLTIYEYLSHCILCNVHHYVMSLILKVELLTQLNMFSEALLLLWQTLTGDHLPVAGISAAATHRAQPKFDNTKQMSDQKNFRVLATVLDRALPPSLQKLYGEKLVHRVMLTQAGLLVAIASTNATVPHQNILSRAGHCSRPGTTLSDYVPSASGHLTSEVPSSAETSSSTTTRGSKGKPSPSHEEIKLLLLEHSEQLICQLCNKLAVKAEAEPSCHQLWMLVRAQLLLARVARLYHQALTAVKICHNAIVLLQQYLDHAKSIVPVWGASPAVGTHMWLVCQLELLDSLTHCHVMPKGWGDCMSILEEGLKGTTACGDDILADRMKLKGVLYFLKIGECDLLKRYLPHSPLQGQRNLTNLQTQLIMCDEVSHDPYTNYSQLEEMIIEMLMERTPSSDSGLRQSAYQHELYLLLAHVGVQLSYEQLSQISRQSSCTTAEDECKNIIKRLGRVMEISNLYCGGQCITLKGTALFCLAVAWRKIYNEDVMTSEPLHEVASKYIECLLTIQPASIAHVGLVVNCYLALAELFIVRGRAQMSPVSSSKPASRSGRSPDKDTKESYRDKIVAWNCVKAAAAIKQSYTSLSTITASLHKEDILKTLPDKALVDLPDFVLVELCGSASPYQDPLPVESLTPSRQSFSSTELTWLPILNYHYSLHRQFTPTHGLLPNGLPADVITTSSQCSTLHHFLSEHLPYYSKTCVIPAIPKVLIPYTMSQQSAPAMTGSYTPVGEWEVVILWNTPVFNPSQVLHGIVSLHHKSSTQQQASIRVFTITVMSQELESLLSDWLQLANQHEQTVSDSRQGEKTSSKSKKKLKQIGSGTELEELISQQVHSLLAMLSGTNVTDIVGKIPTVSAHSVPTIAKLLQPLGQCTANGEDVYKLFHKLSELLL